MLFFCQQNALHKGHHDKLSIDPTPHLPEHTFGFIDHLLYEKGTHLSNYTEHFDEQYFSSLGRIGVMVPLLQLIN